MEKDLRIQALFDDIDILAYNNSFRSSAPDLGER